MLKIIKSTFVNKIIRFLGGYTKKEYLEKDEESTARRDALIRFWDSDKLYKRSGTLDFAKDGSDGEITVVFPKHINVIRLQTREYSGNPIDVYIKIIPGKLYKFECKRWKEGSEYRVMIWTGNTVLYAEDDNKNFPRKDTMTWPFWGKLTWSPNIEKHEADIEAFDTHSIFSHSLKAGE